MHLGLTKETVNSVMRRNRPQSLIEYNIIETSSLDFLRLFQFTVARYTGVHFPRGLVYRKEWIFIFKSK